MPKVNDRAAAYGKAAREYSDALAKVTLLRQEILVAEDALSKAEKRRNLTQRELLEEATHY